MARGWKARAAAVAAVLWWGSLTTTGVLVVPMLFAYLPSPPLAGQMAARLFTAQTWIALGCGMFLLMAARSREQPARIDEATGALGFVLAGVLLALLMEFAVAPRILARDNMKLWHGIGSGMYLLQWLCAAAVLWKLAIARAGESLRSGGPS